MKRVNFRDSLNLKLSAEQRQAIEELAKHEEITLGAAARVFLAEGIRARGKDDCAKNSEKSFEWGVDY